MEEQKEEKKEAEQKDRCEKCGSLMLYVRIKAQQKVCRRCGYIKELK